MAPLRQRGANCNDIGGATNSTYTLVTGDVGKTIRVIVTATNAGPRPRPRPRPRSCRPRRRAVNTTAADDHRYADRGQTLTTTTAPGRAPRPGFTYQWQRCDSAGANCNNIGGATNATYTLVTGDAGDDPGERDGDERPGADRDLGPDRSRARLVRSFAPAPRALSSPFSFAPSAFVPVHPCEARPAAPAVPRLGRSKMSAGAELCPLERELSISTRD